jgi:Protein of unknown function (DUF3489)
LSFLRKSRAALADNATTRRCNEGSPRDFAGLWAVRAPIPAPRTKGAQTMPTLSIENASTLESAAPKKGSAKPNAPSRRKAPSRAANPKKPPRSSGSKAAKIDAAKIPPKAVDQQDERVTKQERMLTLLSRPEGASIEEMMHATDWQQHSVRGFLAGTVKRKLGFLLTSSKPEDGATPPLLHQTAPWSLRWEKYRSMSRRCWSGFLLRRSSNCAASGGGCIGCRRHAPLARSLDARNYL